MVSHSTSNGLEMHSCQENFAVSSPGTVASGKTGSAGLDGLEAKQQSHSPTRTALKQGATPGDEAGNFVCSSVQVLLYFAVFGYLQLPLLSYGGLLHITRPGVYSG